MTDEAIFKEPPAETPGEYFGDTPWMRHLCRFDYSCELCGEKEQVETYISSVAASAQDYRQGIEELTAKPGFLPGLMDRASLIHHRGKGDLDELMLKLKEHGPREVSPRVMITILPESRYTCDSCGDDTFTTAPLLWEHMAGCQEGRKIEGPDGTGNPEAVRCQNKDCSLEFDPSAHDIHHADELKRGQAEP